VARVGDALIHARRGDEQAERVHTPRVRANALFALAASVCALALAGPSCTDKADCSTPVCANGATFAVRLNAAYAAVARAEITLCRNDACGTRAAASGADAGPTRGTAFAIAGAVEGSGVFEDLGGGTLRLTVTATDALTTALTDGDHYTLSVVDPGAPGPQPTRTTLLQFDRSLIYERVTPNGPECGCRAAFVRVYPTSASGLTCTGRTCTTGIDIHGHMDVATTDVDGATLKVCRNATCAGTKLQGIVPTRQDQGAVFNVHGALDMSLSLNLAANGVYTVDVHVDADPADLAQGDRYVVEIRNPSDGLIFGFDRPVTYDEAFPDGVECDVVPCRTASVSVD
jgi:hypothetical protein